MRRQVILILASILLVVITGANLGTASPTDWPMFRNNVQHTGVAADVLPPPLSLKWKVTFGGTTGVEGSPAIFGPRLYIGAGLGDNRLYAIDTATGAIVWSFDDSGLILTGWDSSPAVATVGGQTVIFAGNTNGIFYAIQDQGATPLKLWSFPGAPSIDSSAVLTTIAGTQVVIFGSSGGGLFALVAATGAKYPGWVVNPALAGDTIISSPAILGSTVFVGSATVFLGFSFYAINLANGVTLWSALPGGPPVLGSAAVFNVGGKDLVFFGAFDSKLYAFNAATGGAPPGTPEWTFATAGPIQSSPAIATITNPPLACGPGSTLAVFFGSKDNNFYAVRAKDGTPCWTFPSTGASNFDSSATVSGQTVYIGSMDDNLYAIDLDTGSWQWSFPATAPIGGTLVDPNPVISGSTLYFGSMTPENRLYAFQGPVATTTLTVTSTVGTTTTATASVTQTSTVTTATTTVSTGTTQTQTATQSVTTTIVASTVTVGPPGPIPGFPIESILVGILGGLVALTLLRRRRRA